MPRILRDLARAGSEGGHDAAAVDDAHEVRHAEPEARGPPQALAIALEQIVHEVHHGRAHGRALQRVGQRPEGGPHDMLVPPALPHDLQDRGHRGRPRPRGQELAHALQEVVDGVGWNLTHEPARHRARGRLEIPGREPRRGAGQQLPEVESPQLVRHELLGQHAVTHHAAHAGRHQLPVRRDERGVGNGQPQGSAEDRGDREPVGQPPHEACLGDGEDPPAPPGGADRIGEDGGDGGGNEDGQRETALATRRRGLTHRAPSQRRRDGRSTRARFTSHTPRGVRRTDGRKSAAMKKRLKIGS